MALNGYSGPCLRTYGEVQPFRRLHAARNFPGNGTGLATVRQVVELHDGRVWAQGDVGADATFYFTLDEKAAHDRSDYLAGRG
jgi:light-regulated signal transduction histidine kinase (bacteriophytochrome)